MDELFEGKPLLWADEAFLGKPFGIKGLQEAVSLLMFGSLRSGTDDGGRFISECGPVGAGAHQQERDDRQARHPV